MYTNFDREIDALLDEFWRGQISALEFMERWTLLRKAALPQNVQ